MSKLVSRGGRGLPWVRILLIAREVAERGQCGWNALTPRERRELQRLLKKSGGKPGNLSSKERQDLVAIAKKAARAAATKNG